MASHLLNRQVIDITSYVSASFKPKVYSSFIFVGHLYNPFHHFQVLVDAFNIPITRKDLETFRGLNWLNDEVINFYMQVTISLTLKRHINFKQLCHYFPIRGQSNNT